MHRAQGESQDRAVSADIATSARRGVKVANWKGQPNSLFDASLKPISSDLHVDFNAGGSSSTCGPTAPCPSNQICIDGTCRGLILIPGSVPAFPAVGLVFLACCTILVLCPFLLRRAQFPRNCNPYCFVSFREILPSCPELQCK